MNKNWVSWPPVERGRRRRRIQPRSDLRYYISIRSRPYFTPLSSRRPHSVFIPVPWKKERREKTRDSHSSDTFE